jgi:hypothetical protein
MNCCKNTVEAAEKGHLECLKFLHENGCPWDSITTYKAVINGHLECLKYAHSQGCEWFENITYDAVEYGHLEILKYLHSQGCKLNYNITCDAVEYGHLEILKYAHSQGCQWNPDTTLIAARILELDCLLYCLENGCPIHHLTLITLSKKQINKNLLTNIKLRKILFHPRIKNDITVDKYPEFVKAIEDYEEYKKKVYTFLESEMNLPTDIIKYEIIKYI